MEWMDILRMYGPQSIPWIALAYVCKWILDRYDRDLDSRVKLATALEGLSSVIERNARS